MPVLLVGTDLAFDVLSGTQHDNETTLYALNTFMTPLVDGEWSPPPEPDPDQIFDEAVSDTAAGRYEDALAKHVWFHQNALRHEPSLYGVRLSFALSSWAKLGGTYPPALAKLKSIRDDTANKVRETNRIRDAFHDFASINETLQEDGKTRDLFVWLDSDKPSEAEDVFDIAEPALIKAKEYRLCGDYIEADESFQELLNRFRENTRNAQEPNFDREMQESDEKRFTHGCVTLAALLVLNGRKADAEGIAAEAVKEWDDSKFRKQMEKAKDGQLPAPWP